MHVPVSKTFPNILKQKQIPLQTRPSQPFPHGQTPLSSLPRLQHPVTSAPVSHLPAADFQRLALLSPSRQAGRFPSSTTVGVTLSQRAFFSRHDELSVASRSHPARISSSRGCLPWEKKTDNIFDFKEQKCAGRSFFLWIRQFAKTTYKLPGFLWVWIQQGSWDLLTAWLLCAVAARVAMPWHLSLSLQPPPGHPETQMAGAAASPSSPLPFPSCSFHPAVPQNPSLVPPGWERSWWHRAAQLGLGTEQADAAVPSPVAEGPGAAGREHPQGGPATLPSRVKAASG